MLGGEVKLLFRLGILYVWQSFAHFVDLHMDLFHGVPLRTRLYATRQP